MHHRSTRTATALAAGLLATALVAGCSSDSGAPRATSPAPTGAPSSTATASSSTAQAAPSPSTTKAAPSPWVAIAPELRPVMEPLYAGGTVRVGPGIGAAVTRRTPRTLPATARISMGSGTWKGTRVAAVKVDGDVTLLTKEKTGWTVAGGWWPSLKVGSQMGGKRFVALLGADARPGEDIERTRADSIHILGADGKGGGGLLGVARDTWVTLPSGNRAKINAAMMEGGPTGMVAALRNQTGLPVQGYVYTDFPRFISLVNNVGGLTVTLPYAIDTESAGVLPAGKQTLRGPVALSLARERHTLPNGDFDRSRHQGLMILAGGLAAKADGPTGLPSLMTTVGKYVETNLTAAQVLTLFALPYTLDLGKVGNKVSAGSFGTSGDGQSIVLAGGAEQALYADFRDGNLTP